MSGPSKHLSWDELSCRDGTPYPHKWRTTRAYTLAYAFEILRMYCGSEPITVVSAYRTPEYNAWVGGVEHSQHIQGRALDLLPPDGMSIGRFYANIVEIARAVGIKGIGKYSTFIHIDTRPTPSIVFWGGA